MLLRAIGDEFKSRLSQKETAPVNRYEGSQSNDAVVVRDRRGTTKADLPDAEEKGVSLGSDPLAIYKPTGARIIRRTSGSILSNSGSASIQGSIFMPALNLWNRRLSSR